MDFDDLDEELERRIAAGEEVIGHMVENHQPRLGTVLPLMARNTWLPGVSRLPEKQRHQLPPFNGEAEMERKPLLRLLCLHGVADSFAQEWHIFANEAPPHIEVVRRTRLSSTCRLESEQATHIVLRQLNSPTRDSFASRMGNLHNTQSKRQQTPANENIWRASEAPVFILSLCFVMGDGGFCVAVHFGVWWFLQHV